MPAVAAVIFFFPYTFAVWGLHQIPPPSQRDIAMKVARKKMMAADRTKFLKEFWPGIVAIIIGKTLDKMFDLRSSRSY